MSRAYIVDKNSNTRPMADVLCKNEDIELQRLLELNADLLPGEQINPESPRRWLQIAREMPVPDPSTGSNRWSIDFFLVDQSAMPTFVEVKRYEDTRARREVIGQMLEYAANGHHYWSKDQMRSLAEASAKGHGESLEDVLEKLGPDEDVGEAEFFEQVENNLRSGQVRLVFFMEKAPQELKSVVDFLNRQMERSEVLLVEASQFQDGDVRIVVPQLFGYTEEARLVKKNAVVKPRHTQAQIWDYDSFIDDAESKLTTSEVQQLKDFIEFLKGLGCEINWGTGATYASCLFSHPITGGQTFLVLASKGRLDFYFPKLPRDRAEALKIAFEERVGATFPENAIERFPAIKKDSWLGKDTEVKSIFRELLGGQ